MKKCRSAKIIVISVLLMILSGICASAKAHGLEVQSQDQEWGKVQQLMKQCETLYHEEEEGQKTVDHQKRRREICRTAAQEFIAYIEKYSENQNSTYYVENLFRYGLLLEHAGDYRQAEGAYMECDKHSKKNEARYDHVSLGVQIEIRLREVRRTRATIDRMENRLHVN